MSIEPQIYVTQTQPETPHNAALYEAGKALLVDSVTAGRDFCKFMVGVAAGAIPTYLALVGLVVGRDYRPTVVQGGILLAAPILFLCAATMFAVGLLPLATQLSLDLPDEIDEARTTILGRRQRLAKFGFVAFVLGTLVGMAGLTYSLADGLGRPHRGTSRPRAIHRILMPTAASSMRSPVLARAGIRAITQSDDDTAIDPTGRRSSPPRSS